MQHRCRRYDAIHTDVQQRLRTRDAFGQSPVLAQNLRETKNDRTDAGLRQAEASMPQTGTSVSNFGFAGADEARSGRELTYIAAISEALREEMRRDPRVLILGEDIAGEFGGAFKVTKGLEAEFGARRVMNTPIAELGFTGMATGMALMGLRPVVEMQFADFVSCAFDSIVQFAATAHYRNIGAVPWVIRAPSDGGLRSGPFHSQNPEAWFVHTPGL